MTTRATRTERLIYIVLGLILAALSVNLGLEIHALRGVPEVVEVAPGTHAARNEVAPSVSWTEIKSALGVPAAREHMSPIQPKLKEQP